MKKYLPIIIGVVIIVLGVGVYFAMQKKDSTKGTSSNTSTSNSTAQTTETKKYSDACKIFAAADISAALGGTFGEGTLDEAASVPSSDNLEGSNCAYQQDNDGTTTGLTNAINFSVNIDNFKNVDNAKAFMDSTSAPSSTEAQDASAEMGVQITNLDGIGDQAFLFRASMLGTYATGNKTQSLYARLGSQIITLNATKLTGLDHEAAKTGLTTLAKKL